MTLNETLYFWPISWKALGLSAQTGKSVLMTGRTGQVVLRDSQVNINDTFPICMTVEYSTWTEQWILLTRISDGLVKTWSLQPRTWLTFIAMTYNYKPPFGRWALIIWGTFIWGGSDWTWGSGGRGVLKGKKKNAFCVCCGRTSFANLVTMFSLVLCCFLVISMSPTNKTAQWKAFMIPLLMSLPIYLPVSQISTKTSLCHSPLRNDAPAALRNITADRVRGMFYSTPWQCT